MIEVLRAGLLTTVQDLGRTGFRSHGVPPGGALDPVALRIANLLVGNPPGAAGLEATLSGPRLHFTADALIAVAGADMPLQVGSEPVPALRPLRVLAGDTLDMGPAGQGCRAYLAIAGGLAVEPLLGSRSTSLIGAFGGWQGRALRIGDQLPVAPAGDLPMRGRAADAASHGWPAWFASPELLGPLAGEIVIRLIPGAHSGVLDEASRGRLFDGVFRVTADSDRMGCRLTGGTLTLLEPLEPSSEGVAPGTVQLPPGGDPIILLADGGTTGGYPRIGHVATVDLPRLAQLRPGDSLRFGGITVEEAHLLLRERERRLARLALGIQLAGPC